MTLPLRTREFWSGLRLPKGALTWATRRPNPKKAYEECPRGDWLFELVTECWVDPKVVTLALCDCVNLVLPYLPEGEPLPECAIQVVRLYAQGEVDREALEPAVDCQIANSILLDYAYTMVAATAGSLYYPPEDHDLLASVLSAVNSAANVYAYATQYKLDPEYNTAKAQAEFSNSPKSREARLAYYAQCADILRQRIPWEVVEKSLSELK